MSADVPLGRFVVWVIVDGDAGHGVVVNAVVPDSVVTGGFTCGVVFGIPLGRTVFTVGAGVCFVERTFARWAHMCPIVDARWSGGCLRSCFVVIVGNLDKYPRLMARERVDRAGENKALEMNSTLSAIVGASTTALSEWEY